MSVVVSAFGAVESARVDQFTLTSDTGVEIDFIGLGALARDWRVPVGGGTRSVLLGFETLEPYLKHSPYMGAIVGRVANRIGGASFMRGSERFDLQANEGANQLHGGAGGFGRQVWTGEADNAANAVRFSLTSPDGDMGFPGNVNASVTYTLTGNRLRLDFAATADALTPLSLVQHDYFNLGLTDTVLDHSYQLETSAYTEPGPGLVPTGNILEVAPGSDRYLRVARPLRDRNGQPLDFDTNLVLDSGRDLSKPVATVVGPDGALTLQLWTDRPGIQFYNAVTTNVPVPGLGGRRYGKHCGFCLEDQAFPDAVNHPHFPSIWYGPDRHYSHWCEIEIG